MIMKPLNLCLVECLHHYNNVMSDTYTCTCSGLAGVLTCGSLASNLTKCCTCTVCIVAICLSTLSTCVIMAIIQVPLLSHHSCGTLVLPNAFDLGTVQVFTVVIIICSLLYVFLVKMFITDQQGKHEVWPQAASPSEKC